MYTLKIEEKVHVAQAFTSENAGLFAMELLKGKITPEQHKETVQSSSKKVYTAKSYFSPGCPYVVKLNLLHVKKKVTIGYVNIHLM